MRHTVLPFLLLTVFCRMLPAQAVATLDYHEGMVTLIQTERVAHEHELSFGEPMHDGDILETGHSGYAELSFGGGRLAVIRVHHNTAYAVSAPPAAGGAAPGIELFVGKVRVILDRGAAGRSFQLRSQSVVLGVRGTEFDVMTSPDGALLLGVRSGSVDAQSARAERLASAGEVLEILPSGAMEALVVPVDRMDAYFEIWLQLRSEAFSANPSFFLHSYAQRFPAAQRRFFSDAERLAGFGERLQAALAAELSAAETVSLRAEAGAAAVSARGSIVAFEQEFHAIIELLRVLPQGFERSLARELQGFIESFNRERIGSWRRIAQTRYILSLYDRLQVRVPGAGAVMGRE